MNLLLESLRDSDLEQFYPSLTNGGVTKPEDLLHLTPHDYTILGVTSSTDRKNLYSLVQKVKAGTLKLRRSSTVTSRMPRSGPLWNNSSTKYHTEPNKTRLSDSSQHSIPRLSDPRGRPRSTGRKSLNLDAYGVPVKSNGDSASLHCRLSKELAEKIRVCVRKRPLSKREKNRKETDVVDVTGRQTLVLNEIKVKVDMTKYLDSHKFIFDEVMDSNLDNLSVYEKTTKPLIQHVFDGGKATCFAYGQTGSGKTYTMLDELSGLYVLTARDMFDLLKKPEYRHLKIWISFFEIYQGNIIDLLNKRRKLNARDDGKQNIVIKDLREVGMSSVENLMEVFDYGSSARSTGTTEANADSSRSHAIMQLTLKTKGEKPKIYGKFSFIDLAGSERGADRGDASAQTRLEGAEINKSLLALKECIRALDQDKSHLPFRQSKLTQVLKESFVGDSRTCMIATISPNIGNSEHTLNTLRYADRVKELRGEIITEAQLSSEPMEIDQEDDFINDSMDSFNEFIDANRIDDIDIDQQEESQELNYDLPDESPVLEPSAQAVINIPTRLNFTVETKREVNTSYHSGPQYSSNTIETIARNHRNQILLNTELCRSETKLLSDLSQLSSNPIACKEEFENYLLELDEVLERKLVCIEDLKEQLAIAISRANKRH